MKNKENGKYLRMLNISSTLIGIYVFVIVVGGLFIPALQMSRNVALVTITIPTITIGIPGLLLYGIAIRYFRNK